MKVLTIQSIEKVDADTQLDIHYILRMEHYTDYVFMEKGTNQYGATITMSDTTEVIDTLVEKTTEIPEYTFIIDDLDTSTKEMRRFTVKNGDIEKKQGGEWEWDA